MGGIGYFNTAVIGIHRQVASRIQFAVKSDYNILIIFRIPGPRCNIAIRCFCFAMDDNNTVVYRQLDILLSIYRPDIRAIIPNQDASRIAGNVHTAFIGNNRLPNGNLTFIRMNPDIPLCRNAPCRIGNDVSFRIKTGYANHDIPAARCQHCSSACLNLRANGNMAFSRMHRNITGNVYVYVEGYIPFACNIHCQVAFCLRAVCHFNIAVVSLHRQVATGNQLTILVNYDILIVTLIPGVCRNVALHRFRFAVYGNHAFFHMQRDILLGRNGFACKRRSRFTNGTHRDVTLLCFN